MTCYLVYRVGPRTSLVPSPQCSCAKHRAWAWRGAVSREGEGVDAERRKPQELSSKSVRACVHACVCV